MSNNMSLKKIKDPIHGFIEFEGEFELGLKNILSDPFFQRLRRVKQLGFSDYVFPSATHSRFAHSLGVYSVAKQMLSIVEPNVQNGNWSSDGQVCLAAALLHDVGHGMFSHAFENAMEFYIFRRKKEDHRDEILRESVNHEKVSQKIITGSSLKDKLSLIGGEELPRKVSDIISKSNDRCIYTSIVSGQLDADRLDYSMRDPYFAGVSSGGVDLDWLIRNLKVNENNNGRFFYVDSKAYISLEQFAVTLFHLYPTLYLHKKTRGLEYMFSLLMSHVFELIENDDIKSTGLIDDHPFVRFFLNPDDIENSLLLDDTLFWGSLFLFKEAKDSKISNIANCIYERKIYPVLDIWRIADSVASSESSIMNLDARDRVSKLDKVCRSVAEEIKLKEYWGDFYCHYDTYDRPIYKKKGEIGGHPQQINVEVGGEIVDIASISPIVASAASFNVHRIYYDCSIDNSEESLHKEVRSAIGKYLKNI